MNKKKQGEKMNVHPIGKRPEHAGAATPPAEGTVADRTFQIKVVALGVAITMGVGAIYALAGAYFFHEYGRMAQSMGFPDGHRIYRFFSEQETNLTGVLVVASLASTVLVAGASLLFARSVASALQRLTRQMTDVAEGRTDAEVQPRAQDWFPELVTAVNGLIRARGRRGDTAPGRKAA